MNQSDPNTTAPTMQELASRDGRAWSRLFRTYEKRLGHFFAGKVPPQDVDDMVQQTFCELLKANTNMTHSTSPQGYLFGIARHVLSRYYRPRWRKEETELEHLLLAADIDLESQLSLKRQTELLNEAMNALPDKQKDIIELHYLSEMSTRQISETLDVPFGTVCSRLRLARNALIDKLP